MKNVIATKKKPNGCRLIARMTMSGTMLYLLTLVVFLSPTFAADDDVPFFAGQIAAPNIMFIFDNSDSMQDIPYQIPVKNAEGTVIGGRPVRPGTEPGTSSNTKTMDWPWKKSVKIDTVNEAVKLDATGKVVWDDNAFPTDNLFVLPEQIPVNLPGTIDPSLTSNADTADVTIAKELTGKNPPNLPNKSSLSSTMTSISNSGRITDSSLNWTHPDLGANFDTNYKYRLVEIISSTTGVKQYATITGKGADYFTIETAMKNGASIAYVLGQTYTYTVLTDGPGRVTRYYSKTIITDGDIDWSGIDASWIGRYVKVTVGTNSGLSRKITSYNSGNKAWTVDSFPVNCDETSLYEIVDAPSLGDRIIDTSLDWAIADTVLTNNDLFNLNYLYRRVIVTSEAGTSQVRTITGRDPSGKYFTVDTAIIASGMLDYTSGGQYTYTISTEGPGEVTRARTEKNFVTDAAIDWQSIASGTTFNDNYLNTTIEITDGKNDTEKRTITGYNATEKYWIVTPAFPVACDLTTRYSILGSSQDNRLAFGGNHPASKLYQAKYAVKKFLEDPKIKSCLDLENGVCNKERFAINFGFATYLSGRVPRVMAKYVRKFVAAAAVPEWTEPAVYKEAWTEPAVHYDAWTEAAYCDPDPPAVPEQACARYKSALKGVGDTTTFTNDFSGDSFTTTGWETAPVGTTNWNTNPHTGVTVGYQFEMRYNKNKCNEQPVRYKVISIVHKPGGDGSYEDRHEFKVQSSGYWTADWVCLPNKTCSSLPDPHPDGRTRIPNGTANCSDCQYTAGYDNPPTCHPEVVHPAVDIPAIEHPKVDIPKVVHPAIPAKYAYQVEYRETFGQYNVTSNTAPQYVNRTDNLTPGYEYGKTHIVNPFPYFKGSGFNTGSTSGVDTDLKLVTKSESYVIDANGTEVTINPAIFDTSYFVYPGQGTSNNPDGWSYKVTNPNTWMFGASGYWNNAEFPKIGTKWPLTPSYPSPATWLPSTWSEATNPGAFPASVGNEMGNFIGNDHTVFVNLPAFSSSLPFFGDDVDGNNVEIIKRFTQINRVHSQDDSSAKALTYDYTIMPYTDSIAPNAYSLKNLSGTPIAASLKDAEKYFANYKAQDMMDDCRQNYVVFLTDGLESADDDRENAPKKAAADLLLHQNVKTYVVGFGLDQDSKAKLEAIAEAGGTGVVIDPDSGAKTGGAYFANNVTELVRILVVEIAGGVLKGTYTRSTPKITSYVPGEDLELYSARFEYPGWQGHLFGYDVDPNTGMIKGPAKGWDVPYPECNGDAGCIMAKKGRGTLYTSIKDTTWKMVDFNPDDLTTTGSVATLKELVNPDNSPAKPPFDLDGNKVIDKDDSAIIMQYTKNSGYDSGKFAGTRDITWPLGDIYHSVPIAVGPPSFKQPAAPATGPDPYAGYDKFKEDYKDRETLVYVGANDGMLHAFQNSNGQEKWAYIPNAVLGKLREFRDGHRFTVDGPIRASDIVSSVDSKWQTLLVGGLRGGGKSIFALNVTNPLKPAPAWEVTDTAGTEVMGNTWSTPNFGRIMINGVITYVIIVGGGYPEDDADNTGNNIYILDAASGTILKEIKVGSSTNHVPSEILLVTDKDSSSAYYNITETGYFGDTDGDLYKITGLNTTSSDPAWNPQVERIHKNEYVGKEKVFHKPAVYVASGNCTVDVGGVKYLINPNTKFIFYGTGDETKGTVETSQDRFYEIADPPLTPVLSGPELSKIWERKFDVGEKMLYRPVYSLGVVYFTTYTPMGDCNKGTSYLWGIKTTKCGFEGNTPGIVYDKDGNVIAAVFKIDLGPDMSSGIEDGGLVNYVDTGEGANKGEDTTPIPKPSVNKLEYWREAF